MFGSMVTTIISFATTNIDDIFVLMLLYSQLVDKKNKKYIIIGQYLGIGILVVLSILGAFGLQAIPQKYVGWLGVMPIVLGVKAWFEFQKERKESNNENHTDVFVESSEENIVNLSENYTDNSETEITKIIDEEIENIQEEIYENKEGFIDTLVESHAEMSIENPAEKNETEVKMESIENFENIQEKTYSDKSNIVKKTKLFLAKIIKPEILSVMLITMANGADNIGIYIPLFRGYTNMELIMTIIIFALMISLWCFIGEKIAFFPAVKTRLQKYKHILVPIVFIGLGIFIMIESGLFVA